MILRVRQILFLMLLCLPFFEVLYAQEENEKNDLFPISERVDNTKLKEQIDWKKLSCVFSNETNLLISKPVFDNLKEGVYLSVGGELGLITGALSPKISYLLLLDMDSRVVLYNRWKLGLIGISKNSKDLLFLIKKATYQEIIDRVNRYDKKLPFGSRDALLDPFCFELFNKYTRQEDVFGSYMSYLLSTPTIGTSYYKTNYHFYEDQYQNIKSLVVKNKASAHLANVMDLRMMNSVVSQMRQKGLIVSALNLSDAWKFGSLFIDKETIDNKAVTEYDPKPFEDLVNLFKGLTNENSVLIQSKSLPEKDLSYVVYNFDNLYDNKNLSFIPNLMYLVLDRNYAPGFSKGKLLVNPSLEFSELKEVLPVVDHPEDGSACTYNGNGVNWESFKGKEAIVIRYEKSENSIEQTVLDYTMLDPELLNMAKVLLKNTHNIFGLFRKTMLLMLQTQDGFFLSDPISSSTYKGINSEDVIKDLSRTCAKHGLNIHNITGCYIMHTYTGDRQTALPLSINDLDFDSKVLDLPNVNIYNIYALPVSLKGKIIFHAQVKNTRTAINNKKSIEQRLIEIIEEGIRLSTFDYVIETLSEYITTIKDEKGLLMIDEAITAIQDSNIYTKINSNSLSKLEEILKRVQAKKNIIFSSKFVNKDVVNLLGIYMGSSTISVSKLIDSALDIILSKTAETITPNDLIILSSVITLINDPKYYPNGKYKDQFELFSYLNDILAFQKNMNKPKLEISLDKCREISNNLEKARSYIK